jgi:hypothetical protein
LKNEEVYLKAYQVGREARHGLDAYFSFFDNEHPYQSLEHRTSAEVYGSTIEYSCRGMLQSPVFSTTGFYLISTPFLS